ncbi:MAG: ATP synthase F1 subunit delta [Myxococcota bacterium]|jgi:F-type H+-transporting ATPase subunit delta
MANIPVARRYARALLDAAGPQAEAVLGQLEGVVGFLEGQPELLAALSSPALARSQRMGLLDAVLSSSPGLNPLVGNLMKLLTDRNRFAILPFVTRQFRDLVDVRVGRVRGKVTSATKLSDAQSEALKKTIEKLTQRTVLLETKVDPSLIGGAVAQVGSLVFDGSLKAQLAEMARALSKPIHG